jgi:hypothetical protein
LVAPPAPQRGDGGAALPTHGSRYEQVEIGTPMLVLSPAFAHPFPASMVFPDAVKVGAGRVAIVPVGV